MAVPVAGGEVALVANNLVDLVWDPIGYPATPGRFRRWELWRGYSPGSLALITSGTDQTSNFYRDKGLTVGGTVYYKFVVVRCIDPCADQEDEVSITYFEDSVKTGVFDGDVTQSLELEAQAYEIGFSETDYTAAVYIKNNATLTIPKSAVIRKSPDLSSGSIHVMSGIANINGATLNQVSLIIGEYGGTVSACRGSLTSVQLMDSFLVVQANCTLSIEQGGGTFNLSVGDAGTVHMKTVAMNGGINIEKQGIGYFTDNQLSGPITVSGQYAPVPPRAQAYLSRNVIVSAYHNQGVKAYDGATVYLTENTLSFSGQVDTESSVLLVASDADTLVTAIGNTFENGKIALFWGPTVKIEDNILSGAGSAIIVGCLLCGTGIQAEGTIDRNNLQSGWGFEMWDGSQNLKPRHNCIRGNNPGLTVVNTLPQNLDMTENFWGSTSGPRHPSNPTGTGDEIIGSKVVYNPWDTSDATCRLTPPPTMPDLRPIALEIIQSTQTADNAVPLVAGRPTLVRVYAESSRGAVPNVRCELSVYRSGVLLGKLNSDPALQTVYSGLNLTMQRANLGSSFNFYVPNNWAAGNLELVAVLNPGGGVEELTTGNNRFTWTASFTPKRVMRVLVVPIRYHTLVTDTTPVLNNLLQLTWMAERVYPNFQIQATLAGPPLEWTSAFLTKGLQVYYTPQIMDLLMTRLNLANQNRPADQQFDQVYGVFSNDAPLTYCVSDPLWSKDPSSGKTGRGRAAYGNQSAICFTHEIGHNLGLRHPNTPDSCGALDPTTDWKFASATIQEYGVDVLAREIKLPIFHDFMSYCHSIPMWISPFHEQKLFLGDAVPQPVTNQPENSTYLFIRGSILTDGTLNLEPAWQMEMAAPPVNPPPGMAYCVQIQDNVGTLLSQYCFDPEFYDYEADMTNTIDRFEIALPLSSGAARIVVKQGTTIKAQAAASVHSPTVHITYPNGGEFIGSGFTASWQAEDIDGDQLRYHLSYSPDGGLTWQPLVSDLTTNSFFIDSQYLPGSSRGLLKVMASDGFHTSADISDAVFSVIDHPPLAAIHYPQDGGSGFNPVALGGSGYDLEDGDLAEDALIWTSNIDGVLGSGANLQMPSLTSGNHVLTLSVTDTQNQTSSTSITFQVLEYQRVFLPVTRH